MKNSIPKLEGDVVRHGFPLRVKARGYAAGTENDDLVTKGQLDSALSLTVGTIYDLDLGSLLDAILEDPFSVDSWKASFISASASGYVVDGNHEASGDFSTEVSFSNIIGLMPSEDGSYKETIIRSAHFKPSGGTLLDAIEVSNAAKIGGFDNIEWTYKYEENPDATGSDPMYFHDFKLTVDSTQILGYVFINADDSETHNFIIDSAAP